MSSTPPPDREPARIAAAPRESTEAEIAALDAVCERLHGFGADLTVEYVDGWLTALTCTARNVPRDEWLALLSDGNFDRAYGDPQDAAPALAALAARQRVLASQLAPEDLFDDPDTLRLAPLMTSWDDAARAEAVAAGELDAEAAAYALRTGVLWAEGYRDAVAALAADWSEPDEAEGHAATLLVRIAALLLAPEDLAAYVAEEFPGQSPSRDDLIDDACWAAQDLRLYWLECATRTAPRRVEPRPGRNDPCPCGSGRKFKRCHGV